MTAARRRPTLIARTRAYVASLPPGATLTSTRLARIMDCSQATALITLAALVEDGGLLRQFDGSWPRIYTVPAQRSDAP